MFLTARTLRPFRFSIVNLQKLIEVDRSLSHKKYRMMNTLIMARSKTAPALPHYLEKNEIETRILKLLHESELIDVREFRFEDDIRKEYYLDSLDVTALVSSIEEEFNTIFDPDTYDSARSLDVIVDALLHDPNIV